MQNILNNVRRLAKWRLERNVQAYLADNYDWKVARANSTGVPLTQQDIDFRANTINEFNRRLAALNAATDVHDIDKVEVTF